ncbi:MAG: cupin domain-containing protein [Gaiellaceae bacterium]
MGAARTKGGIGVLHGRRQGNRRAAERHLQGGCTEARRAVVQHQSVELPPGGSGPEHEHEHSSDGQEEVYVPLRGGGKVRIDGEDVELRPGLFVFVAPESTRQLHAGDKGLAFVAVGAARE